ncbi:uncharacterized protein etaa1b [Aulostomus maculatus]
MSEPGSRNDSAVAAGSPAFTELWRNASKLCHNKTQDKRTGKHSPTPAMCKDFQSPQHRGSSRYPGFLNNGDSPGDVEASQDIIWDPTSPSNTGPGFRNTRVVEISDIVNRIAPKDLKPKGTESPLLQWIGDSAVPCTPEIPKPRVRKKSSRQSSVDDLVKLARQFDKNMQQNKETSEQLNTINNSLNEHVTTSSTKLAETSVPSNVKNPKCLSSPDQVEAELHALFDCSTQRVSGALSQGSFKSACSQDRTEQPATPVEPRRSELKSADKSGSSSHPAEETEAFSASNPDDFDDDWENDDLLNDSLVLAMTQIPDQQHNTNLKAPLQADTKTNTAQLISPRKATASTNSSQQVSSCSALQELCPKTKTTNRSTFKLGPNPNFHPRTAAKKSGFTAVQPKLQPSGQNTATTTTTLSTPQPASVTNAQTRPCISADSLKDISDSLWDDGDDDALFYQVCDSVERISNSQPLQASPGNLNQDTALDRSSKTSARLPINGARPINASVSKKSPCTFTRSNSLPGTSSETRNYQGWSIPMRGANGQPQMSQSLPGSRPSLGTFTRSQDSSGTFQNTDVKPHTVKAALSQKPHPTAFKRNVSDSAYVSNKVFVTSQMTGKCSAAEIERKKQEALARKRLRMQNTAKP